MSLRVLTTQAHGLSRYFSLSTTMASSTVFSVLGHVCAPSMQAALSPATLQALKSDISASCV